jgi:hypothetical protein
MEHGERHEGARHTCAVAEAVARVAKVMWHLKLSMARRRGGATPDPAMALVWSIRMRPCARVNE